MTVSTTTSRVSYAGNGVTLTFAVPFYFLQSADLVALRSTGGIVTTLVLGTDYTVSGAGVSFGGSVTLATAPATGSTLVIYRDPAATQLVDYQANDPFPAETHERALDKLTMLVQRAKDLVGRAFTLSDADTSGASTTLPTPSANALIGWNASGNGLQNVDGSVLATVVAFGTARADTFTGNGVQTQFTLSDSPAALANLDVSVGGITQLPTLGYTWTSGTTLTFTSAPPNGVPILVRYMQALPQGATDSSASTFLQAGASAVSRSVQDKLREWVSVTDFGADRTGAVSASGAIQAAINTGLDVVFPSGTYRCANLTQSANGQRFIALGNVTIQKNANGPILTGSGSDIELNGLGFRGDASTPTFTGDGVVLTGNNPRLNNCGVRWISGIPLLATGNAVQINGTCDIYQTTDATATGYDIVLGVSGTATVYHRIKGIRTTQATGGIRLIDTGSAVVEGSQFGKYFIDAGTSPAGVNGGNTYGNRILGAMTVEISNAAFACNTFGAVAITFATGTSGHAFDESNILSVGATITDNSNGSYINDSREFALQTYAVTWTGATTNPAIGNGTLSGHYSKQGRRVTVNLRLVCGSTTTFGSGGWFFSLPYVPSTATPQTGAASILDSGTLFYVGAVQTLTDATARCIVIPESSAAQADATRPMTWASGDELRATITYMI
ncbi:MAG: hypothetical protein RI988_743 [Pseudomonadota bacterium]|jgi:hypothetical protein